MTEDVEQVLAAATLTAELIGQASTNMSLYITAVSGYVLIAYFLGKNLTRLQAAIITVLFIYFSFFITFITLAFFQNALYFGTTYGLGRVPSWPASSAGIIQSLGIVAALKFMWDVRHPKTE
jgi:hypothetical protein